VKSGLREAAAALRSGSLSARAYCQSALDCIRERDPQVRAWAALDARRALALADGCDARLELGRRSGKQPGALHGIPIGIKDIIDTADLPTQMGSAVFEGHRPARNAPLVDRLLEAGAYVLGKTVTTEFAFMHPGKTRNPWNPAHTPGGSSSGSAAAVAAGMVPGAIGTQTNGSVIRPAAFCGVVGFKPSFGLIPCAGTLQFSAALDQVGVFTRSVADAAALASVLAGGSSIAPDTDTDRDTGPAERAPRIAFIAHYPWNAAQADAAAQFQATLRRLAAAGASIGALHLPAAFDDARDVHGTIMVYEGARQHAPLQARHRALMSAALNAVIEQGLGILDADYARALNRAVELRAHALELFGQWDVIASLAAPDVAPARLDVTGDPSFCTLWSLAGSPALTLPTGLSAGGLPFGIQLAARTGADDALLRFARWCEQAIGYEHDPF